MAYYKEFVEEQSNHRNQWIACGAVVVVYLLCLLLFTVLGLKHQVPPPPEYGIELDMSGGGGGGEAAAASSASPRASENTPTPVVKTSTARIATQNQEETPKLTEQTRKQEPAQTAEASTPRQEVNTAALFKKRGQSEGNGDGTGVGSGSGSGPGSGTGSGGGNGAGVGLGEGDFWLDGRPVIKKVFPDAPKNTRGLVIVEFRADKEGNVVYAKAGARGTTLNDAALWAECERAAKASKFKAKQEAVGDEKGTIRYKFVM